MAKNILIIILFLIVFYTIRYFFFPSSSTKALERVDLKIKGVPYSVEIAKSPQQKSTGLSNRTTLCPNCGMIFPYSRLGTLPFWMKDTLIPLDMIWLDQTGKIVYIANALPQPKSTLNQLKIYENPTPAQYVLELNSGDSEKLKLTLGDIIYLPSF